MSLLDDDEFFAAQPMQPTPMDMSQLFPPPPGASMTPNRQAVGLGRFHRRGAGNAAGAGAGAGTGAGAGSTMSGGSGSSSSSAHTGRTGRTTQSLNTTGRRVSRNLVSGTANPQVLAEDVQSGASLVADRRQAGYTEHMYDPQTFAMWAQALRENFRNGEALEQAYRIYASRPSNGPNVRSQKMTIREKTGLGPWMNGRLVKGSYLYNMFLANVDVNAMMTQLVEIQRALDMLKLGPLPHMPTNAGMSSTYLELFEQNMSLARDYLRKQKLAGKSKTAVRGAYEQVQRCIAQSGQYADILACLAALEANVETMSEFSQGQRETLLAILTNAALAIQQAINTGGMMLESGSARALASRISL